MQLLSIPVGKSLHRLGQQRITLYRTGRRLHRAWRRDLVGRAIGAQDASWHRCPKRNLRICQVTCTTYWVRVSQPGFLRFSQLVVDDWPTLRSSKKLNKCGGTISKHKYLKVVAVLVSGKEAYGGQKQAVNISPIMSTIKLRIFDFGAIIVSID